MSKTYKMGETERARYLLLLLLHREREATEYRKECDKYWEEHPEEWEEVKPKHTKL